MESEEKTTHLLVNLEEENHRLKEKNESLHRELERLLRSTSWRITRPIRVVSETTRKFANTDRTKRRMREIAYGRLYRIKTSKVYQKLRRSPSLYSFYMVVKSRLKKCRQCTIDLSDGQLETRVTEYLKAKKNRARASVVVYTAVIDNYETLKIPLHLNPDWDYICFSDRADFTGNHPWEIRPIPYIDADPTRCARFVKLRPDVCLAEYTQSIWIDASILSKDSFLSESFQTFAESRFSVGGIPHPLRACTYDEFEACKELKKDSEEILEEQKQEYSANRFPIHQGMLETGLLFRKHMEQKVITFQKAWWRLLNRHSRRDQLSVVPALKAASLDWMEIMPKGLSTANHPSLHIFSHGTKWSPEAIQYKIPGFLPKDFFVSTKPFWTLEPHKSFTTNDIAVLPQAGVDIVICVHNAPEDVERCLTSVIQHMQPADRIIVVDDGSETQTAQIIDRIAETSQQVTVIRHDEPIGYTRAANVGLKTSEADLVILLNSDTIVTPNWSRKLLQVASQGTYVGIVGPMSNAASFQSIPRIRDPETGKLAINDLPEGKTILDMNELCEKYGYADSFPLVPLINGFCMGITRRVIETIGYLDEESFPMGYGEEDDYSQRALDAGFMHAVATHCYVYHAKSKSFGHERRNTLAKAGGENLRRKHGSRRINRAVKTMADHPVLATLRHKVAHDLNIKLEESYKTTLSAHPTLWAQNAQSLALSSQRNLKQTVERIKLSNTNQGGENEILLLRSTSKGVSQETQELYASLLSEIDKEIRIKTGTIDDVIKSIPKKILLDDTTPHNRDDLRELISFCKSRNITVYYAAANSQKSINPSKVAQYLLKNADHVLKPQW